MNIAIMIISFLLAFSYLLQIMLFGKFFNNKESRAAEMEKVRKDIFDGNKTANANSVALASLRGEYFSLRDGFRDIKEEFEWSKERDKKVSAAFSELEKKFSELKEERDAYAKQQELFYEGITNIMNFDGSPQKKGDEY